MPAEAVTEAVPEAVPAEAAEAVCGRDDGPAPHETKAETTASAATAQSCDCRAPASRTVRTVVLLLLIGLALVGLGWMLFF